MERDEAIEVIRKNYPHVSGSGTQFETALRTLIPELKESEDERIRKGLIDYFNDFTLPTFGGLDPKKILAWLEKQGNKEYALKPLKDEDVHKFVQYIERQAKAYELNLPNRSYDIYGFAKDILSWLEKQGSQNLANSAKTCKDEQKPAWSDEDESKRICACKFLDDAKHEINYAVNHKDDIDECITWLKSLKERYTWKPSDEQMRAFCKYLDEGDKHLTTGESILLQHLYINLKKLKG